MTLDIVVRPAPTPEARAAASARVAWDVPSGAAHAHRILATLNAHEEKVA